MISFRPVAAPAQAQNATQARPSPWLALAWALVLAATFVVVYMACLEFTALRADVGRWYFDWELAIPVVPWLIVPYVSIDGFFLASLFLASTRHELQVIADRLALAPLIAAIGFLVFPLRLGYDPGSVDGFFGPVFRFLAAAQEPHNLLPSLHVTYTVILRQIYHRHTRGWLNAAVHVWLALVTASTVLTHQHHLVDVMGGAVAGALVLYLVPAAGRPPVAWPLSAQPGSSRRGRWYGLGAVVLALGIPLSLPWTAILAWPVLSLLLVSGAYFGLGPAVFQKAGGRLSLPARLLLGPYLFGLWLARQYYNARIPVYRHVAPGLIAGRKLSARQARRVIRREGITAVLDLTAEHAESGPMRKLTYHNIQILDLVEPCDSDKAAAQAFIREHAEHGTVYVHCALGEGRTRAVLGSPSAS